VYGDDDEVNTFVGCFYDAVILFAMGLNRTLVAGLPPTNGSDISRNMWNQSFEGTIMPTTTGI
jgi:atrial natriuretic peptide receptor A